MQEKRLIEQVQKGDKKSIEVLYRMNFKSLYVFVRSKVNADVVAEDICAEAFTKSFEKIDSFKGKSSYKTWLYTIAYNLVKDWYSTKGKTVSFDESIRYKEKKPSESNTKNNDSEILKILRSLKSKYREVLELRFLGNLSIKETAEIMNIKPNYVKVLQNRAIKQAKKLEINLS